MKKTFLRALLLLLFIGTTSIASAQKQKYTSTEGKMSVTFPAGSSFETSESDLDNTKTVKTAAQSNKVVFFVSYTIHETVMPEDEDLTQVSVDAFIKALNASITKQSDWKVGKNIGVKVELVVEENNLVGDYRVIMVGQYQYQITAMGSKSDWDQAVVNKFMKSFKLKK